MAPQDRLLLQHRNWVCLPAPMSDGSQLPIPGGIWCLWLWWARMCTCTYAQPPYKQLHLRKADKHPITVLPSLPRAPHWSTAPCTLMSLGYTIGVRQVAIEKTTQKGAFWEKHTKSLRNFETAGLCLLRGRGQLWSRVTNINLPPTPHPNAIPKPAPPQPYPPPHLLPTSVFPAYPRQCNECNKGMLFQWEDGRKLSKDKKQKQF